MLKHTVKVTSSASVVSRGLYRHIFPRTGSTPAVAISRCHFAAQSRLILWWSPGLLLDFSVLITALTKQTVARMPICVFWELRLRLGCSSAYSRWFWKLNREGNFKLCTNPTHFWDSIQDHRDCSKSPLELGIAAIVFPVHTSWRN